MESLYKIQNDLISLFEEIEESGGEITEEQLQKLEIGKENFKQKLDNYCKAIAVWNGDISLCKTEKQRIDKIAKVYSNRIERLKKAMIYAIDLFGDTNKSGNKGVELATNKLYLKTTTSVAVNEERNILLITTINSLLKKLTKARILVTGEEFDEEAFLESVNEELKEISITEEPFNIKDLETLELQLSIKGNILYLLKSRGSFLMNYLENNIISSLENVTDKTRYKAYCAEDSKIQTTLANLQESKSLIIK